MKPDDWQPLSFDTGSSESGIEFQDSRVRLLDDDIMVANIAILNSSHSYPQFPI